MTEQDPNQPPDDRELEEFLARRGPLSRAHREGAQEQAPPELDAKVLETAREELRRARRPRRLLRWDNPLALAASALLVVGLGWLVQVRLPPPAPAPVVMDVLMTPPPAAPAPAAEADRATQPADTQQQAAQAELKQKKAGPAEQRKERKAEQAERNAPAAAPPSLAKPAPPPSGLAVPLPRPFPLAKSQPPVVSQAPQPYSAGAPPDSAEPPPVTAGTMRQSEAAADVMRDKAEQAPLQTPAPAPPPPADESANAGAAPAAASPAPAAASPMARFADPCGLPRRAPAQRQAQPEQHLDSPAWLEQIRELGKTDEAAARAELACFTARRPQAEVPEDLQPLLPGR